MPPLAAAHGEPGRRGGSGRGRCRAPRRSRASAAGSGRCRRPGCRVGDERRLAAELSSAATASARARPRGPRPRARRRAPSRRSRRGGRAAAARSGARRPTTHAPSRSFSTASCAVGQSRPAPATRIFACAGARLRERERLLDRGRQPRDVLAVQRGDRRDRAGVARGVAPRPLDLRRADDHLVGELGERRVGRAGDEPDSARGTPAPPRASAASSPSCETQTSTSASGGASTASSACTAQPAGLRRVERRAAAGEDDARALGQPPVGRHATQPLGLREHRTTRLARHGRSL